ncbi:UNVERIFIED_CONTAM: hypothetical protein POZ17_15020 [Ralstonia mannitolilytica]
MMFSKKTVEAVEGALTSNMSPLGLPVWSEEFINPLTFGDFTNPE